eukprot:3330678-Prymnesium_polylepis.1
MLYEPFTHATMWEGEARLPQDSARYPVRGSVRALLAPSGGILKRGPHIARCTVLACIVEIRRFWPRCSWQRFSLFRDTNGSGRGDA